MVLPFPSLIIGVCREPLYADFLFTFLGLDPVQHEAPNISLPSQPQLRISKIYREGNPSSHRIRRVLSPPEAERIYKHGIDLDEFIGVSDYHSRLNMEKS
jgi:hypothetical protein